MQSEVLRVLADGDATACFHQRYVDRDFDLEGIEEASSSVAGEGPLPGIEGWVGDLNGAAVFLAATQVIAPDGSPPTAWLMIHAAGDVAAAIEVRSINLRDGRAAWVTTGNSIALAACGAG